MTFSRILTVNEVPLVLKHLRTLIRAGLTRHEAVGLVYDLLTVDTDPDRGRLLLPVQDEIYRLERETRDRLVGDALMAGANAMVQQDYARAGRHFDHSDRLEGKLPKT